MADTEPVTVLVEEGLRAHVEGVAARVEGDTGPEAVGRTVRRLIRVGLGADRAGVRPRVEGPLGVLPRPFSRPVLGNPVRSVVVDLDADTLGALDVRFEGEPTEAARQALRLGVFVLGADDLSIRGPLGAPRPFARLSVRSQVVGDRAETALAELQMCLRTTDVSPVAP